MDSKTTRLLAALKSGECLTAKQIASRYGAGNPHELVRQLRTEGYSIYLNDAKNGRGEVVQKYRLGTPSRAMVAAAYAAAGADVFARAA